jgi:glucosamine--fructose-6-phosphate aminotransferase (isomerizing)
MCGIIAVLGRPSLRAAPEKDGLLAGIDEALSLIAGTGDASPGDIARAAEGAASLLSSVDARLRGVPGLECLLREAGDGLAPALSSRVLKVEAAVSRVEARLDAGHVEVDPAQLERVNAAIVAVKDAAWAIRSDRLRTARAVSDMLGDRWSDLDRPPPRSVLASYLAIEVALSALDRLEVRGRDSAGLHVLVSGAELDLASPQLEALIRGRRSDPLFASMAVRTPGGHLSMVYKAAAEIGDLGDNVRALRAAITGDELLHLALAAEGSHCTVLGHTRWASVGVISQANAHPLNSDEPGQPDSAYVTAALNGDVDNHLELRTQERLRIPPEVTTDAKVIPLLVSRRVGEGATLDDAFMSTVARFEGSVAIAASTADEPDRLHLALRGSGQSLYVGFAEDTFVVASEPYGLVEETSRYLRMDGESTHGQVIALDRSHAGTLEGVARYGYDGKLLPVEPSEIHVAEITTRDIDRAGFSHFLLKEISEAPQSFRKTLRGKVVAGPKPGRLRAVLGEDTLGRALRDGLASGSVRRILVVGQGTAAVAGQSVATSIARALEGSGISVEPRLATELSGFGLDDDMADTLLVAVSQSGTTTDTNRTVDLARSRGATVVSIVNRRNSDLVEKSDGVLFTSDGRDVEMSVASTKAFYAQVAAGFLLADALAEAAGCRRDREASDLLVALRDLPDAMDAVLARRDDIAGAAALLAPSRRYWAVVGNGANRIAASEVRIKLSELCYKSIACDATEDKKHIDLSSEPMIVVCAAGLSAANADDVAKELAIYRAHKAAPVVIASEGQSARFAAAAHVVVVPAVHRDLAFVLSAMAGHLFGYEAALSIDAQARPLRAARGVLEAVVAGAGQARDLDGALERVAARLATATAPFLESVRAGAYNGHLEAATAVRLVSLLRYATGALPVEGYEYEYGKVGTPGALIEDLLDALTSAVNELTRPVDAIKHQAKTVTVGISRSEDALLDVGLVKEAMAAGTSPDHLSYRALRTLADLDPAVDEVLGYTRYRIEGGVAEGATIHVVDKGGLARDLTSRTESNPVLRGTKHRAAEEREVTVARGRSDGRTVALIPETKDNQVTGMTLLHLRLRDKLDADVARRVLSGYRGRYNALADAVTETESDFDDARLGTIPLVDLLTEPVYVLADRWRPPV